MGRSVEHSAVTFISEAAVQAGLGDALGLAKETVAVKNTHNISRLDMKLNDALPDVEVNPETYEARADGEVLTCKPATELPMAQRYFMFWTTRAISLTHSHEPPIDTVTLTYDDRFRRRIAFIGDKGTQFTLDLHKATQLNEGDRLLLDNGQTIEVRAASEDVME